jgi:hypothetical protein
MIFAEALRTGAYRLACVVDLLFPIPDWCSLTHMFLGPRFRSILPRQHATVWPQVLVQIDNEFQPPVREPLNIESIVKMAEEDTSMQNALHPCVCLACLNAFLGNRSKAEIWCQAALEFGKRTDREPTEWETRKFHFIMQLQEALVCGRELELLDPKGLWR